MGASEQIIVDMYRRTGQPIPKEIKNKPVLLRGLSIYLEAFFDLDSERQYGFTAGRIPVSKIREYADYYGFSWQQKETLKSHIVAMDAVHLKRIREMKD